MSVDKHDHRERWDDSDVAARNYWRGEKLKWRQVAEKLGRTVGAVKSRLYRERRQ